MSPTASTLVSYVFTLRDSKAVTQPEIGVRRSKDRRLARPIYPKNKECPALIVDFKDDGAAPGHDIAPLRAAMAIPPIVTWFHSMFTERRITSKDGHSVYDQRPCTGCGVKWCGFYRRKSVWALHTSMKAILFRELRRC